MKKILIGMILTVMAAALAACGNGVTKDKEQTQDMDIGILADAETDQMEGNTLKITTRDTTFTATLADNSSAEALKFPGHLL